MSKLYDVISRLEDVAEQDTQGFETPLPEFEEKPRKLQSPALRIVLFSLLFVILGILAVALTAWWQNWFAKQEVSLFPKDGGVQQVQHGILPTEKNTTIQPTDNTTPKKTEETIADNQPLKVTEELLPDTMVADIGHLDKSVETIDDFLKKRIFAQSNIERTVPLKNVRIYIHDLDIAEVVIEETPPSTKVTIPTSQTTNINAHKAKTSRWLHQAELYRHSGEWEAAIALYQRVWNISGEPDVANNLAAALIQVNRLEDALEILREASIIAPNDPDIKENIEILRQLMRQE